MAKTLEGSEKAFLIAAIVFYILVLGMSFMGHYHHCGDRDRAKMKGGLWNVCTKLQCLFINKQLVLDEIVLEMKYSENKTYYNRTPSDYMMLKMGRFSLLSSHIFGTGICVTLGLRIALIFYGSLAYILLVLQMVCHYWMILMAAFVMSVAIPPLYENYGFVVYIIIGAYVLTNVAMFLAFAPGIKQHLRKHKVIRK